MKAISRCIAGLTLAALLAACALAPKLEPPKVSIVGAQIVSADLFTQHLKLRLHVQNPNDRVLPVKGLEYTIEIAGEEFASGESAASFVVPPRGDAEFDTNVTTNLAGAAIVNAVGPIRQLAAGNAPTSRRYLVIAPGTADKPGKPVQRQIH